MHLRPLYPGWVFNRRLVTKTLLIMKFTFIFMMVGFLQVGARGYSQSVTVDLKNAPLDEAFKVITKQSGFYFVYGKEQLATARKVNLNLRNTSLDNALRLLFIDQPLEFTISGKYIAIKEKETPPAPPTPISGRVLNDKAEPLEGITVTFKGSKISTQTKSDGTFTIDVPTTAGVLIFTAVNFDSREIPIGGVKDIGSITLFSAVSSLNEIVVTGYSAQRRKDITGAVSVVNATDLKAVPAANVGQQLQGRASGVTVLLNGTPGVAPKVRVRGLGSFQNNSPLYVIDGIQTTDITGLNSNDIETMQVLKDAATAGIYGVRGSNGVIVITTKKGRQGTHLSYDMTYGLQLPGNEPAKRSLSPIEQAKLSYLVLQNEGQSLDGSIYGPGPEPVLPDYLFAGLISKSAGAPGPLFEGNPAVDPALYTLDQNRVGDPGYDAYIIVQANKAGTNWWKESTRNAPIQSHNLTLSNANDKSRFLLSTGYFEQQAITIHQFYKRYNVRMNSEFKLFNNRVRLGENIAMFASEGNVQGNDNGGNKSNNQEDSDIGGALRGIDMTPVYNIKGDWGGSKGDLGGKNTVALLYRKRNNRNNNLNFFGNVYGELDILKGLTYRSSFGGFININTTKTYPQIEYENSLNQNIKTYEEGNDRTNRWIFTNQLNYKTSFGKSNLSAYAAYEAIRDGGRKMIASVTDFYTYSYLPFINLGTGSSPTVTESKVSAVTSTISLLGGINYDFDDKYLVSALVRRDGSSKFLGEQQYGTFPAFSLGWRISNENFMKGISWLNDLKIRGSWGKLGNEAALSTTNGYTTFLSAPISSTYDWSGTQHDPASGFYLNFVGNPAATWEKSITSNIGIDATIFNNTNIVVDYYRKETKDLLYNPIGQGILGVAGSNPSFKNVGSMVNKGVDVLIAHQSNFAKDFTLTTTLTFTTYNNKITRITADQDFFDFDSPSSEKNRLSGQTITRNMVGESLNSFYGWKVLGIFQSQDEVDKAPVQYVTGTTQSAFPGSFRFEDVSGPDGKPDGIIDTYDRTVIGNPNPDFTYGLNLELTYKNFDFSAFFYGVQGKQNYVWGKWFSDFYSNFGGKSRAGLYDSWLPDGSRPNAKTPIQLSSSSPSTSASVNSYFVEDASYFRLRNAQLGYSFSSKLLDKIKMSRARIYLQATNIFTITKYSGLDPEVITNDERASGIDNGTYPTVRQVSVGANLTF